MRHVQLSQGFIEKHEPRLGISEPLRIISDRLGKTRDAARVRGFASPMGGEAHLLLVGPEQEDELRDYERLCGSAEAFVYAAMIRLMVRRLARG